jgi:regulator of sigma E protease
MTIISFIVVLAILIFVHELGHFLAAKSMGVKVLKFSLGFGPKLIGKKIGDTDYMISALPVGGYVRMAGENPSEEISEEEKSYSYLSQKTWKKIVIASAGSLFNFFFAVFVLWIVFMAGVPVPDPVVGELTEGYPAAEAGILSGDRIVSINGTVVDDWEEMAQIIKSSDGSGLMFVVMRDGEELTIPVIPVMGDGYSEFLTPQKQYMIGIAQSGEFHIVKRGPLSAFAEGVTESIYYVTLTYRVIGKMFTGEVPLNNIGGPILIAQIAGETARQGIVTFLSFLALISINLAILNLLPVPVLDGGHLLFFVIEGIIRRPISLKVKEVALQIGLVLLVVLMVLAFYFDIARIIGFG